VTRLRAVAALHGLTAGVGHRAARTRHVAALERDARARGFVRVRVTELVVATRHPRRTIEREATANRARHELGRVTTREEHQPEGEDHEPHGPSL